MMEFLLIIEPFFKAVMLICGVACFFLLVISVVLVAKYSESDSINRAYLRFAIKKVVFLFVMFGTICAASVPFSKPLDIYGNMIMYRHVSQQLSGEPKHVTASFVHFLEKENLPAE